MNGDSIRVLIVEPARPCRVQEIGGLEEMQRIVGGEIEAVYPFADAVAVVCNAEGKLRGLPLNRPLRDKRGAVYDVLCGTFFVAGLGGEDFISLTDSQIHKYKRLYDREMICPAGKTAPGKRRRDGHAR